MGIKMLLDQLKNIINKINSGQTLLAGDAEFVQGAIYEIKTLHKWIADCQSGMYINCVYCGYRYGPRQSTPTSMSDILKEHIEKCPKHPMSELKIENETLKAALFCAEKYYGFQMDSIYRDIKNEILANKLQ